MTAVHSTTVSDFFEADATNWDAYYQRTDVFSVIHQLRRSLALAWLDQLSLPRGTRVADVGCGTGLLAIALARRGLRVTAVDSAVAMLGRAAANVAAAGVGDSVTIVRAAAEQLPLRPGSYDLIVALGLVPWVRSPNTVVGEMVAALARAGHLLISCDNRHRLPVLLDPKYTPPLAGLRSLARRRRRRHPGDPLLAAQAVRHSPREFDRLLAQHRTEVVRRRTFGFGPFSFLGRELLPTGAGVAVHRGLDQLAGLGVPGVRSTGTQYLVLAVKP